MAAGYSDSSNLEDYPYGQIVVEFVASDIQVGNVKVAGVASQWVSFECVAISCVGTSPTDTPENFEKESISAATIQMSRERFDSRAGHLAVSVLVHEILHALGLSGHPGSDFSDSTLHNGWFRLDGSLTDIDIAALQALYLRLSAKTVPEDLSIDSLGPWDVVGRKISNTFGPIEFGVRRVNDVNIPFTTGPEPSTSLANNNNLRGNVVWSGELLGVTANTQRLEGDSSILVNLGTLAGSASFTNLHTIVNEVGSLWGDGSLNYNIKVGSNYLYSTGGDAGEVSGQFYGTDHQYVGGSIERSDLTAAFGGARE